jgi:hypothetical protein
MANFFGLQTFGETGAVRLDTTSVLPRIRYEFIAPPQLDPYLHVVTIPGLGALLAAKKATVYVTHTYWLTETDSRGFKIEGDTITANMGTTSNGEVVSVMRVWYWG